MVTPQNPGGIGWIALLSRKPDMSLKRSKIGPRLLWMTYRKLHTRFRLLPTSMTSDDHQRGFRTLFQNTFQFGGDHHENFNEDRPTLSAAMM